MDFPKIKKEISLFLTSQEAKVLKKNIVKLGLTASVIAAIIAQTQDASAAITHNDSHADGHTDSHNDTVAHIDTHSDTHSSTHSDATVCSHDDHGNSTHSSVPAAYNPIQRTGGHSSNISHTDHADFTCP